MDSKFIIVDKNLKILSENLSSDVPMVPPIGASTAPIEIYRHVPYVWLRSRGTTNLTAKRVMSMTEFDATFPNASMDEHDMITHLFAHHPGVDGIDVIG